MQLQEVRPGYARLSMRVQSNMVNGQNLCRGGLIFALADSSETGDQLVAEAQEVTRAGRSGIYDVRVTNQDGKLVALFRGKSVTVKRTWIE